MSSKVIKEMFLTKLVLYNFKNYEEAVLQFEKKVICFVGDNGSGKTNLLDAIHYLGTTRSFFNPIDSQNIHWSNEQCSITGELQRDDLHEQIVCTLRKNQRKIVKRNFKEYERLSEHLGFIPVVIITPYDIELIWEGSEVRRKFLDSTIAQLSKSYLENLQAYNHALLQRNNLLKSFGKKGNYDVESIEPWDYILAEKGNCIYRERTEFLIEFSSLFQNIYQEICGGKELTAIEYRSDLNDKSFDELLRMNVDRDRVLERTSAGIHRDDLDFTITGNSLKKFASQGQQKSFLFALKLTQYLMMQNHQNIRPILMLDDLFDKIDESRMSNILNWLSNNHVGQIFITDTHAERIPAILSLRNLDYEVWEVNSGQVAKIAST